MTHALPLWTIGGSKTRGLKYAAHLAMVTLLACTMIVAGCSTSWVTTLDDILTVAAPALINILNIISIAKGQPFNTALAAQITTDVATIKTLTTEFAAASAAAAPGICSQLQAAISTYSADQSQVLALAVGLPPTVATQVSVISLLVAGTVTSILALIPNCDQAARLRASLAKTAPALPLRSFISAYNTQLKTKTGVYAVDAYTAKHQVHVHGWVVRHLTIGTAN